MKTLLKALAEFQQEAPIIHKGAKGYGYDYADYPSLLSTINPLLHKHKLGFYHGIEGTQLKTVVFHFDGEMIEALTDIPQGVDLKGMNEFQVLGSGITYLKRYTLEAMLGLATSKDTDANGTVSGNLSSSLPKKSEPAKKATAKKQESKGLEPLVLDSKEWKAALQYLSNNKGKKSFEKMIGELRSRKSISKEIESKLKSESGHE